LGRECCDGSGASTNAGTRDSANILAPTSLPQRTPALGLRGHSVLGLSTPPRSAEHVEGIAGAIAAGCSCLRHGCGYCTAAGGPTSCIRRRCRAVGGVFLVEGGDQVAELRLPGRRWAWLLTTSKPCRLPYGRPGHLLLLLLLMLHLLHVLAWHHPSAIHGAHGTHSLHHHLHLLLHHHHLHLLLLRIHLRHLLRGHRHHRRHARARHHW